MREPKPRYSCTVRDRSTGAVVTLDYPTLRKLSDDFTKVLRVLATSVEQEQRRTDLYHGPTDAA